MQTLKLTKKYETYPEYKDSGVEWLGKIPKDWKLDNVQHLFTKVKRLGFENEELLSVYRDRGVIIKSSRDDNHNKASEDLSLYQLVEIGDLAINKMKAWQGSIAVSNHRGIVSPAYFICKPLTKNDSRFIHHLLRSNVYIKQYERNSGGVRNDQWDLNYERFRKLEIAIPKIIDQTKIANYLDKKTACIDQIIEKKQKQIELLREKRTAVINNTVTKGLSPETELVESGVDWIGKIPKGWSIERLKGISQMNKKNLSENTDPNFSFKYFDIGSVDEEEVSTIDSEIIFSKAPSRARRIVSEGDSIIATVRTYLKAIAYFEKIDTNTVASTGFAVLTPKERMFPKYLFYYLQSDRFINQVIINSKGIGYPAITPFDLGTLETIFPDKKEQELAVAYLDKKVSQFNLTIDKVGKSVHLLKEFKSSLISNAVTGKIKI
jgi:type I restriction enzyme S subunit